MKLNRLTRFIFAAILIIVSYSTIATFLRKEADEVEKGKTVGGLS